MKVWFAKIQVKKIAAALAFTIFDGESKGKKYQVFYC